MDGFGRIEHKTNEPAFHEPWEGRVLGMVRSGAGLPSTPNDVFRHRLERLDPVKYLSSSYYERWLAGMENALIEAGRLRREEIDARVEQFAADPDAPMPRREDPARAHHITNILRAGRPNPQRKIRQRPRFNVGDKIMTRNLNPPGHTRLPRYARGKRGVIVAHHGAHVFPDSSAHGLGENPQHLYTVRFVMRELWGDSAEPNESAQLDLWESYLEKDKTAARSPAMKAKKVRANTPQPSAKVQARTASAKRSLSVAPSSLTMISPAAAKKSARSGPAAAGGSIGNRRGSGKPMRRSR
jgi:nitrile hydratase